MHDLPPFLTFCFPQLFARFQTSFFFRATNTFSHILLDGVEPRREYGLHLCPGHGNEGGRDLADVGDDGEREGDPDDGEDDAEHATADSLGGDVAIAYEQNDGRLAKMFYFPFP